MPTNTNNFTLLFLLSTVPDRSNLTENAGQNKFFVQQKKGLFQRAYNLDLNDFEFDLSTIDYCSIQNFEQLVDSVNVKEI